MPELLLALNRTVNMKALRRDAGAPLANFFISHLFKVLRELRFCEVAMYCTSLGGGDGGGVVLVFRLPHARVDLSYARLSHIVNSVAQNGH